MYHDAMNSTGLGLSHGMFWLLLTDGRKGGGLPPKGRYH